MRTGLRDLLEDGRDVALELRRLVHGDLRGMFDGPTTPGLDLSAPLVILDLSALYTSTALGILMACATAWLQAALARTASGRGARRAQVFLVVDEAWAILSNLGVARVAPVVVEAVTRLRRLQCGRCAPGLGPALGRRLGLRTGRPGKGLLADSETRVIYAQSPGELAVASDLFSLSTTEAELLPQLRRGVALWKVGQGSFLVQHRLSHWNACW